MRRQHYVLACPQLGGETFDRDLALRGRFYEIGGMHDQRSGKKAKAAPRVRRRYKT
jgi:hypothetical protein